VTADTPIHVRAGLAGCSFESALSLQTAFTGFLRAVVEILRTSLPFLLSTNGGAVEARQRLALAALKV